MQDTKSGGGESGKKVRGLMGGDNPPGLAGEAEGAGSRGPAKRVPTAFFGGGALHIGISSPQAHTAPVLVSVRARLSGLSCPHAWAAVVAGVACHTRGAPTPTSRAAVEVEVDVEAARWAATRVRHSRAEVLRGTATACCLLQASTCPGAARSTGRIAAETRNISEKECCRFQQRSSLVGTRGHNRRRRSTRARALVVPGRRDRVCSFVTCSYI